MLKQAETKSARRSENPDEGPEDMELTLERPRAVATDKTPGVFDRDAVKRRGGVNTAPSAFEKGVLFRPGD